MTRRGRAITAVVIVAGAAAAVIAAGGAVRVSATAGAPDLGPGTSHLCQPGEMDATLHLAHPLFRRPAAIGGQRAAVTANGWAWFADAPSTEGI